jgi:hemerythrin-like domain-containing protein
MQEYLNKGVKRVIDEFPEVGGLLDQFGIGCVPCSVGTCLLRDVVGIHNLPPEDEKELMSRIARVVSGEKGVTAPKAEEKTGRRPQDLRYSPPIRRLVDEHVFIKRVVAAIPELVDRLDVESEDDRRIVREVTDFIRNYADRYHHAKEENILFKYFDEDEEILRTMRAEHEKGRGHVRATLEALDGRDGAGVAGHLLAYHELLKEHIKKEDEILYVWMDGNLSTRQVGELFSKFREVEEEFGGEPREHEAFAERLEAEFRGSREREEATA